MAQLSSPVEPFGEVNVFRSSSGKLTVKATILIVPPVENAKTGLAIDGSASMQPVFGHSSNSLIKYDNVVEPVARSLSAYLANFSSNGKCSTIYWACNPDGSAIEEIGQFSASEVESVNFAGPRQLPWGRMTKLLPPVRYFSEIAFCDSPWSIALIVTDGDFNDLLEVKKYCLDLGRQMARGERAFLKIVLIGITGHLSEAIQMRLKSQMEELDDMFEGSGLRTPDGEEIDIWDHKIARDMKRLEEIFSELVPETAIVIENGRIVDNHGRIVADYPKGVPAVLKFDLSADAKSFTLDFPGGTVTQEITEVLDRV
jgi:hypothetical protein